MGYNVYSGTASQSYTSSISVGNVTNATIGALNPGTTYYFSITARDASGNESPFSNEISYTTSTNSSSPVANTPPTISAIANQTINANGTTASLAFKIGDLETPAANLTVSAASSDQTVVPNSSILLAGNGTNWTVTITPALGQTGTVMIALTVCDPSLCTSASFQLTVMALPLISLTSPTSGATYTAPGTVSLGASVTANGHAISQVQFFNGSTLLGAVASAPYVFNWNGVPAGAYSLSASAVCDAGSTVVSSAGNSITVIAPPGLPPPWQTADIGTVGAAGSATITNNSLYTVRGAGNLTSSSDNFRFLYQSLSGDGEVRAEISSVQNTSSGAVSGVMIRETLTSGSKYAFMGVSPNGAIRWQRRSSTGSGTATSKSGSGTFPTVWTRVVRSGNTLYGLKSSDGVNWTTVNSSTISMAPNIYVGFAVASGTTSILTSSVSTNITVVP